MAVTRRWYCPRCRRWFPDLETAARHFEEKCKEDDHA